MLCDSAVVDAFVDSVIFRLSLSLSRIPLRFPSSDIWYLQLSIVPNSQGYHDFIIVSGGPISLSCNSALIRADRATGTVVTSKLSENSNSALLFWKEG
jgi:hypothetical protein